MGEGQHSWVRWVRAVFVVGAGGDHPAVSAGGRYVAVESRAR
jgi:hypothetical protein